jgi:tRNA (adenine57-N1/adenine58-N1)-methyltransferase
MVMAAA